MADRAAPSPPQPAPPDTGLRNLWRFMSYSKPYWRWLVRGFFTGLVRMVLPLYMPFFVKSVVDEVVLADGLTRAARLDALWGMLPLPVALMAIHALATVGRFYAPSVAGARAIRDIRYQLYRHLQRLSLGFHTKRPTGGIVARIMSDVEAAQHSFDQILIQASQCTMQAVIIAGFLLWRDWEWALVSFAAVPVFVITTHILKNPIRQASRDQRRSVEKISGLVQERMAMIREVQAFTAEQHEQRRIHKQVEELKQHTLRQRLLQSLLMAASELTRISGLLIVLVFGVYRVTSGEATPGDLFAFYSYLGMLLFPIQHLTNMYGYIQNAGVAADRIFAFFDSEPAIKDSPSAAVLDSHGPPTVTFENVSFSYPSDEPVVVLRNISFQAKPGMRVALVGESGAGKSTVMSLLPRFYDVGEGSITIDGTDLREMQIRSLRQAVAIVPQEPVLFSGTIYENILYGRRDATRAEVVEAARAANAEDFIGEQPDGYDTVVGERGVGLSGGQIQRIAIARAFLKNPAVLIMDEATSNLDAVSESLVLEAIERLAEGRTSFIIAHRLSTARSAGLILAMRDGEIVERGSHDELLASGGVYAELWQRQMGDPDDAPPAAR